MHVREVKPVQKDYIQSSEVKKGAMQIKIRSTKHWMHTVIKATSHWKSEKISKPRTLDMCNCYNFLQRKISFS